MKTQEIIRFLRNSGGNGVKVDKIQQVLGKWLYSFPSVVALELNH